MRAMTGAWSHRGIACAVAGFAVASAFAPTAAADRYPNDAASCQRVLDNCYANEQMIDLVQVGERMVNEFLDRIGIAAAARPRLTYVPSGTSAPGQCVDVNGEAIQSDRSFNYCGTDNTVYIGQNTLWASYQRYGAAGPISGVAHEYGHFLQSLMRVPLPDDPTENIQNEDQADCVSGAFMGYLHDRGDIEYPSDVDSIERYLTATASIDAPGRDHGTAQERIDSFQLGYTGALPACNGFYPATPLE